MKKAKGYADDAPLTAAELRRARPLRDVEPDFLKRLALARKTGKHPPQPKQETVSVPLDARTAALLRKSGKGWQTRLNDLVRVAVALMVNDVEGNAKR